MFEVNITLVIFIVSFLIFIKLFDEAFVKPVGAVLERRAGAIADDHEAGRQKREQARVLLEDYEKDVAQKRLEAQSKINAAVSEAQAKRTKAINQLKEDGRKKLDAARASLKKERGVLIDNLVSEESNLVQLIVGKLLGDSARVSLSSTDVKRALEESL